MKFIRSSNIAAATLIAAAITLAASPAAAQNSERLSSQHIPDDAIAAAFLSPAEIMSSPGWELMPIEVIQASGIEHVGVDPMDIEDVQIAVGMPGPMGPQVGIVVRLRKDFDIGNLKPEIMNGLDPKNIDGLTVYESRVPPLVQLHQADARTVMIGVGGYLKPMLDASGEGTGPLPMLARKLSRRSGITLIAVMQPIRPLITGLLMQSASELPPQLQDLTNVAEWVDAVMVNLDYAPLSSSVTVSALGRDEDSAARLEQSLNNAIDLGRMMAAAEIRKNIEGEAGPIRDSIDAYIDRVGGQLANMVRPQRNGNVVRISLEGNYGGTGVMVGLLLPAVQAAREAARRMTASNHLKEIGLALHNHHSAYRKLPDRAIRDQAGNPLLSWRVKILPFLDQQPLYDQFRLNEPWDSPHNIQLLDKMPECFEDPSVSVAAGHTVFQACQGPGLMFEETGELGFRDVTDGISNTMMVVEASSQTAVPWTKPADLEFDLTSPLAKTGDTHQGGFHALMADGAVVFLTNEINPELMKALLTRGGNEAVEAMLK